MGEVVSDGARTMPAIANPAITPAAASTALRAWSRWLAWVLCAAAIAASGAAGAQWWWRTSVDPGPMPVVIRLDLYARMADLTPITITVAGTDNAPWHTTIDQLRRTPALWRLMHLENWNALASPLREEVLDRMLSEYRSLLMNPRAWDRMTPEDWDEVPQPVRTVAYRQMVAYWAGYYRVGAGHGLDPVRVRDTLQAIAMSESWWEHRASQIDILGNHDMGLAQASDYARERLRQLAGAGVVDVSLADEDYWNPWQATRFLSIWMSLLLDETGGDLDRAVRAYNRGIARADDATGRAYQSAVERRRRRFIQNQDAPEAWAWLWVRARLIEAEEWPWLHASAAVREGR